MKKSNYIILALALMFTNVVLAEKSGNLNVMLIVVDDQGYADFSALPYAARDIQTPNLDKLIGNGTLFSRTYVTAPVCSPSRAGFFTGKYQQRWDMEASWNPGLPDHVKTIAEYLKEAGYATFMVGKNDYGVKASHDDREYPLNHGYDEFLGFSHHAYDFWLMNAGDTVGAPVAKWFNSGFGPLQYNNGYRSIEKGRYATDVFTDQAIDWMSKAKAAGKPFLLTLNYNAVHHLIEQVPVKYLEKYGASPIPKYNISMGSYRDYYEKYSNYGSIPPDEMRKYYLANLNCLDDNIGRLTTAMKKMKISGNTLVVYISDNGGSPLTGAINYPLSGSKYVAKEGGLRVPMIISYPGSQRMNQFCNQPVSSLDIVPTCLEAAGIDISSKELDGISLLGYLKNESNEIKRKEPLFALFKDQWAVIDGDWKLVSSDEVNKFWFGGRSINSTAWDKKPILINLSTDTRELMDYSKVEESRKREMQKAYEDWVNEVNRKEKKY